MGHIHPLPQGSYNVRHGVDGDDGTSCTTPEEAVDGDKGSWRGCGLMIPDGRDGLNGQQGVSGDRSSDGIGGTGCQTGKQLKASCCFMATTQAIRGWG